MTETLADIATPLRDAADLDRLIARVGDARYVLLGEASHGTSEYYRWRAAITRRLVTERDFTFVAVEGDWPDCARINQWVKGAGDEDARSVLQTFNRWPTWMWNNVEVADFISDLRSINLTRPHGERVGFYGLDVYSLWDSMRSVLAYLREHEPDTVKTALEAWRCFEPYAEDPQEYAWATRMVPHSCEDAVITLLRQIHRTDAAGDSTDQEARFDAEQNAAVAAGAERYYRAMIRGGSASWNVRDHHMSDTLGRLMRHHGPRAKAVVWEHNTHVGDARATDMAAARMVNVGQLVRERHGDEGVVIVGFAGYAGTVVAADAWGAPLQVLPVPPAREGSLEDRVHREVGMDSVLVFDQRPPALDATLGHRAIGVVYHPDRERYGNYVPTVAGDRYDALCYFEQTAALTPL